MGDEPLGFGSERRRAGVLALLLLIAALGASTIAWVVYPQTSTLARSDAVVGSVDTSRIVNSAQLTFSQHEAESEYSYIRIDVWASVVPDNPSEQSATITVLVPHLSPQSLECGDAQPCVRDMYTAPLAQTYLKQRATITAAWEPSPDRVLGDVHARAEIKVKKYPPIACDEYSCKGSVPRLLVKTAASLGPDATFSVQMSGDHLTDYTWESDYLSGDKASPYLIFTTPLEAASELAFQTRFPVDGRAWNADQEIGWRTFLAGALVGVAGGAAIGALQEGGTWLSLKRRGPPVPQGPPSPSRRHPAGKGKGRSR